MSEKLPPSSHRLKEMASAMEDAISPARSEQMAARAIARAQKTSPATRRMASVLGGVSVAFLVVFTLGATSATSLPGDALYGVSRAYESVGDWVGVVDPVEQRLQEVIALTDRGDVALATRAAEEALAYLEETTDIELAIAATSDTQQAASVQASPAASVTVEQANTLRLAAELLLQSVQDNGDTLEAAAVDLAVAVSDVASEPGEPGDPIASPATTTTTLPEESSTTTTLVDESTTTTIPDESSTTTTIPEDEEEGDGDGGEGEGPIFIPPGS